MARFGGSLVVVKKLGFFSCKPPSHAGCVFKRESEVRDECY